MPASKTSKLIAELARLVVGATFVFSGFVKAVDPMGFAYKIEDYLVKLGAVLFVDWALPVAVVMVVAEFVLGALLLLGVYRKWSVRGIALFMLFFTPLTLWIAIANPVADCGCFGDALVISNWQTFYKNVVLSIATIYLLFRHRLLTPFFHNYRIKYAATSFCVLFGLLFALHNVFNLPMIDFRPYKIGANIPEQMAVPDGEGDVYENIFIYEKDGKQQEFTEENYPWEDTTWTYVDMTTKLIKEGKKPAIEDFSVELTNHATVDSLLLTADITADLLSEPLLVWLIVAYSVADITPKYAERLHALQQAIEPFGMKMYCLTASSNEQITQWVSENTLNVMFAHTDERVLKTMIRSTPGVMLIKEGVVLDKWDSRRIPSPTDFSQAVLQKPNHPNVVLRWLILALLFVSPLLLLKYIDYKISTI